MPTPTLTFVLVWSGHIDFSSLFFSFLLFFKYVLIMPKGQMASLTGLSLWSSWVTCLFSKVLIWSAFSTWFINSRVELGCFAIPGKLIINLMLVSQVVLIFWLDCKEVHKLKQRFLYWCFHRGVQKATRVVHSGGHFAFHRFPLWLLYSSIFCTSSLHILLINFISIKIGV